MDRKHFRGILRKYLQSRATPEEEQMIDAWYAEMGEDADAMSDRDTDAALEQKYWFFIHSHLNKDKVRKLRPWKPLSIAASLLIVSVAVFYYVFERKAPDRAMAGEEARSTDVTEVFKAGDVARRITLPDGSLVVLEAESQLKFSFNFQQAERIVHLDGEAFFEISRNAERPFLVHTKQLTTRVLGTSFRVIAIRGEKDVTVSVRTGKVSVYPKNRGDTSAKAMEIILTPNQKIIYDKIENKLSKMIVKSPEPIIPAEEVKKMRFENAPILQIFAAIEKAYGVDIDFDKQTFSSCFLTTAISDGDIFNRLDIICNAIGARYELKEDHIVITGRGCDNQ